MLAQRTALGGGRETGGRSAGPPEQSAAGPRSSGCTSSSDRSSLPRLPGREPLSALRGRVPWTLTAKAGVHNEPRFVDRRPRLGGAGQWVHRPAVAERRRPHQLRPCLRRGTWPRPVACLMGAPGVSVANRALKVPRADPKGLCIPPPPRPASPQRAAFGVTRIPGAPDVFHHRAIVSLRIHFRAVWGRRRTPRVVSTDWERPPPASPSRSRRRRDTAAGGVTRKAQAGVRGGA